MKAIHKTLLTLVLTFLASTGVAISATEQVSSELSSSQLMWILIITMIVVALACLMLTVTIWMLLRKQKEEQVATQAQTATSVDGIPVAVGAETKKPSIFSWSGIYKKLTDAVPIDEESSIDMGHEYDGIRELDNNLPPWWKWGFYFTIAFGLVYLIHFHVAEISAAKVFFGPGVGQAEEYAMEMEAAEEAREAFLAQVANLVDESSVTQITDADKLANGKAIYMQSCVACHGTQGEGGIGPNLTDEYWIHGGSISDVFKTIKYGVPAKGMIAWEAQIKPTDMQDLSSYIMTMQGTNPANGKEPQGEKYIPENSQPQADSTSQDIAMLDK